MFSRRQTVVLALLLVAGLLLALELLYIDYMVNYSSAPFRSFCNIDATFNCDAVAASPFSHVLGVPVAFVGVSGNLLLLLFLLVGPRLERARDRMKSIYTAIFGVYALGCAALAAISIAFVPALCIVCMAFWVVSIGTFVYLAAISGGAWRRPIWLAREVMDVLVRHKAATLGLIGLLVAANALMGYRLSSCGCNDKGPRALECEGFEAPTFTSYLGRSSAKVDVVIYTDFQCPWCKRAHQAVMDMVARHEKQVRFVRKDFPLDMACNPLLTRPFHGIACKAAVFAKCAGLQGKYWEYHDELYRSQESLSDAVLDDIARLLALDVEVLHQCAASDGVRAAIQKDIAEAARYHVNGTPAFRIFGELHSGMITEAVIADYVASYPAIHPRVLRRVLAGAVARPVQLVDVREPARFAQGRIEGAVSVPLASLRDLSSTRALNPAEPTLLYDEDGTKVNEAFEKLARRGFGSLHTLSGGYAAWSVADASELSVEGGATP